MARAAATLALLAVAALAPLAIALGAAAHGSHKRPVRGALVYKKLCAGCHGTVSHDDGVWVEAGAERRVDLTRLAASSGRFERRAVAARIDGPARAAAHGTAEVPVWGDPGLRVPATEERGETSYPPRLRALLDFLEHVQRAP
jgi:hypothetical protein